MITVCFSNSTVQTLERDLHKALKLNNAKLYRIVYALLQIAEGVSFQKIADCLKVSVKTVYTWFCRFMASRFTWLRRYHYQGRGRKSKLSQEQKDTLYDLIVAGPAASGFDCGIWNTAMIAELIVVKFNQQYNPRYLSTLLRKMGLSYQKARFVSDKQAEADYKKARANWMKNTWPRLLKKADAQKAVILFGDEVSFAMWGSLARTWAPVGKQPEVKTTGIRKGLKMFGAIEFHHGGFHYMESLSYSITAKSLKQLKADGLPKDILVSLKDIKKEKYSTQTLFLTALQKCIGVSLAQHHQEKILACTESAGKFNGETYVEFLGQLLDHYTCPVILIEDGAPYHRSAVVKAFVKKHKNRLTMKSLPTFSPDFNPIEKLWKNTKRDATHLQYFKTFEDLRNSVIKTFKQYLNDAAKIVCVMAKMRKNAGLS